MLFFSSSKYFHLILTFIAYFFLIKISSNTNFQIFQNQKMKKILFFTNILIFLITVTNACSRNRYADRCYECNNCEEPFNEYSYSLNKKSCSANQVCMVSYLFTIFSIFMFSKFIFKEKIN